MIIDGPTKRYHGGCAGCIQPHAECLKCQYMKSEWQKPSMRKSWPKSVREEQPKSIVKLDPNKAFKDRNNKVPIIASSGHVWGTNKTLHIKCNNCSTFLVRNIKAFEQWIPTRFKCPTCNDNNWRWAVENHSD